MENPLDYDDDDVTQSQFNQLLNAIIAANDNGSEEEIKALNELVQREVTAKPILARIVHDFSSLLSVVCTTCQCEHFHPAIKFLIVANPSALLWQSHLGGRIDRIINIIANHSVHCVLMPWIATNYQWILDRDHDIFPHPSVFDLLHRYANREETGCTAAIIRQFFEAYPRGLTEINEYGYSPLHEILMGSAECEPDLFKWMAEQCPSNMLHTDREGEWTPLHRACRSLTRHRGDDSSEICKYLIEQCPESVRVLDNDRCLPIHMLLRHCQHRIVKEVVVLLLREYPESYDMATVQSIPPTPAPSSNPFVQRIKPLLDEEGELKENVAYLQQVSGVFHDAVEGTDNSSPLASSTYDAFSNWSSVSFAQRLEAGMQQIETQLQDECNADEEEDGEMQIDA